jgi:hypothetical protein
MALQTLNTIKQWFRTGLKPTQQQFWDTWDSFRHKSEKIPVADVEGIDELLLSKTDNEVFESHLTDENTHQNLLAIARIIPYGEVLVFKTSPEGNPKIKESSDFCLGYINGVFICGTYSGNNSYDIKSGLEL